MINDYLMSELKPIITDPGFEIIVKRVALLLDGADRDLHQAKNFEEFCIAKGGYDAIKKIYRLLCDPKQFAEDGIVKMSMKA